MLVVDDLRPMLGCYGDRAISTPNIDRLAARGATFLRAYAQAPQCGPSRESVLTGLRPETTGIYTLRSRFTRAKFPQVTTLPELFKRHGYQTQSFGKIYHDDRDDLPSWSRPSFPGRPGEMFEYVDEASVAGVPFAERSKVPTLIGRFSPDIERRENCPPFQAPDVPDDALFEGRMTTAAIAALQELKSERFFLAVGYRRPHLPWVAPKKYFDQYPREKIPVAASHQPARNAPIAATFHDSRFISAAWRKAAESGIHPTRLPDDPVLAQRFFTSTELRSYRGVDYGDYPDADDERAYRQAYMACVSYVDAQIGRLLDGLEQAGLASNTIVVLWSDHGWHLGEHGMFGKLTHYEWSTRVPLILAAPGKVRQAQVNALVELSDIYPTLCELAGIPTPGHVEGTSFVPQLKNPAHAGKAAAFTRYPREEVGLMGSSVRTEHHRYVEWTDMATGAVTARELYDHRFDPGEMVSLHTDPNQAAEIERLAALLHAGWQAARHSPGK